MIFFSPFKNPQYPGLRASIKWQSRPCRIMLVEESDGSWTGALSLDFLLRVQEAGDSRLPASLIYNIKKAQHPQQKKKKKFISNLKSGFTIQFGGHISFKKNQRVWCQTEVPVLYCLMVIISLMCVSLFLSLGPSDAYSSTLSSLNSNLWPHLTDQMVFPKINHGFLSADQQLIKRRLIKVVLILAQVWFLLYIQFLLCVLLLYHLSLMGRMGWWVFILKYTRAKLCVVSCICLKGRWKF